MILPTPRDVGVADSGLTFALLLNYGAARAVPAPSGGEVLSPLRLRHSGRRSDLCGGRRSGGQTDNRLVVLRSTSWSFFSRVL